MPRRRSPDPLALAIGQRIKQLRAELGLTIEKLAYESELGSKGYLSDIEKGLALPTVKTLKLLAEHLGLALLDVVTFPEEDDRQKVTDRLRKVRPGALRRLLRDVDPGAGRR